MEKLESQLAYFRIELARNIERVTQLAIEKMVREGPFPSTNEEKNEIIRYLEAAFDITQSPGHTVLGEHIPWLARRKSEINFYYWNRLKQYYLSENILPPHVTAALDRVTDEVLDYSGNPAVQAPWRRRGMVIGHVQSGKTTNYASLICKASDAGYKIIILLTGITNSLRQQTQERLDEAFIGRKSIFQPIVQDDLSILHYAAEKRFPAYGTTRDKDFSKAAATTYGVSLSALAEPIIFITKKNKTILERLRDWLRDQNPGDQINHPLILIDDEADNASINTQNDPTRVTAINRVIREILALFSRCTYIGYTATPFANIFIDADSEDEMLKDDLFPRHFIKALDPPSNYVGATRIFLEDGDLSDRMVRVIADFQDILPLKHKRDLELTMLPASLHEAIRVFLITRAMQILRGQENAHCSMMVNASVFNDVQDRITGLVYQYLEKCKNALTVNAGLEAHETTEPIRSAFKADFAREFSSTDYTFADILRVLTRAASTIQVRTVNMKGGSLDYSLNREYGLHVIAIGGLALSRGLTLQGLTVSYILRNASASDTLMQMARWFGYRPKYESICRLYLPQQSRDHYEYITEAIEELRAEVENMETLHLTPNDFGLRVRQSPAVIRITAANKMRSATPLRVAQDFSGRHVEGHVLWNNQALNFENLEQVKHFVSKLGTEDCTDWLEQPALIWRDVDISIAFDFIRRFRFPETHPDLGRIKGDTSLFLDYIADRMHSELTSWDIALPYTRRGKERTDVLPGRNLCLRAREAGMIDENYYKITSKQRVANPDDAKLGLDESAVQRAQQSKTLKGDRALCHERQRPLLIIHIFANNGKTKGLKLDDPIVSLSFCMPRTKVLSTERTYQVNTVYRAQLVKLALEADDDDVILDEVSDD